MLWCLINSEKCTNCNTLMFPSSVYNTIICGMYKLIQPIISFKILVENQDTFSILEILLKVSLKQNIFVNTYLKTS
jgi:hypothetical protein